MHELITDQSFDLNRTNEYELSIQVGLDGFSFSVIHPEENRLMALKNTPVTISTEKFLPRRFAEWVNSEPVLNNPFEKIKISYYTENFTLIPYEFHNSEKQNKVSTLLFENKKDDRVKQDKVNAFNSKLIYTIPGQMINCFADKFNDYTLNHTFTVLTKKTAEFFASSDNSDLFLFFSSSSFLLFLYDKGNLLLTNSYQFKHANDIVYYIFAALNQNRIHTKNCKLLLSGNIIQDQEIENLLKSYFSQIGFLIPELQSNPETFNIPLHFFIPLF